MSSNDAINVTLEAIWLIVILSAPPIIVASVLGILVALFQSATQLQEQTFQYAIKFVAIAVTIAVTASFLGDSLLTYSNRLFADFYKFVPR